MDEELRDKEPHNVLKQQAIAGQWSELWWSIPAALFERLSKPGPTLLAALTGVLWLIFLLQALQVDSPRQAKLWLALLGVPLGVLSLWPTFFLIYWQEYRWGIVERPELVEGLQFFVLGVGFREELAKALCCLPLLPLLLKLRSELAALLVSACVGLGFAAGENATYFAGSGGIDALGRFIMASPFHMSLTGLIGLAIFRGARDPRGWGPNILATFLIAVFAHGLYDALQVLPALVEFSMGATITFALIVYQFFRELRELRPKRKDTISLSATFLCAVALVTACTFVYVSSLVGWQGAMMALVPQALGLVVMVYLFLREMPETMVTV